jgi:hypothetical protein
MLMVGCGSGVEAGILERCFNCDVVGIDLEEQFDPDSAGHATLHYGDATDMGFENDTL